MTAKRLISIAVTAVLVTGLSALPANPVQAYSPTQGTIYQLPASQPCLKGRGNCAIYPKIAELPSGRLIASWEQATVPPSGSADGETLPIYKSDDSGTTWQKLADLRAPAYLSSNPAFARYTSNWGNPFPYVLPQAVGDLPAGTLLMASIVTGDDYYYLEHKAADPNWVPTNDGDRRDMALALFSSTDSGATWNVLNIITTGGWQGGSAGAIGVNVANANTYRQIDPVWEPYLMVYNNQLVVYYSDENDYIGYNATTGVPTLAPDNDTRADSGAQILAHRTWNGLASSTWGTPVLDVAGTTFTSSSGQTQIGGGRPGMTTVVPTSDGRWLLTYEYWGGGDNVRYKISDNPLNFYSVGGAAGTGITALPLAPGSRALARGGSPVLTRTPDGRILYNASGSGNVWINSGSSTGAWTEFQTTLPGGYSRNLTWVSRTGRVIVAGNVGTSNIIWADIDFGRAAGPYYRIVNRLTGQVIGTGNHINDANIGNADSPDVRLEASGSASNAETQAWRTQYKSNGAMTLLNRSGGRMAGIWTGTATAGQRIGQWVDNTTQGHWSLVPTTGGYYRLQSAASSGLYLTGASAGASLTLQNSTTDGSQEWQFTQVSGVSGTHAIVGLGSGRCIDVPNHSTAPSTRVALWDCTSGNNQRWTLNSDGSVQGIESGLCLDVRNNGTANGAIVQTYTCNGGNNQKWTPTVDGTLRGVQSGLCLDAVSAGTANGTLLQLWACNGGNHQRWNIS
ncbi:RICIN domain-containing protein [Phytohabitans rumicis]|uniref:Ricin B lectin domain-containing protein n=1 Tax=Phytohabitans rumicis TaxID=1076125 RepID=A0A6V8LF40_9ACTN|nr:RICIN domain-containing protein [Phytohabitans rumicis]GFJ93441.1 hypothetical protein Prum_070830 [Phytohabitans rumicis]